MYSVIAKKVVFMLKAACLNYFIEEMQVNHK